MDDLAGALERLAARMESLEQRVLAIEALEPSSAISRAPAVQPSGAAQTAEAGEELSMAQAGGAFSVLGKAMLGIAGAYLLRAVAQSNWLPSLAIAGVAIVYALLWLAGAARVRAGAWFAGTVYACTSALILAPMLWELTLSFKVLPAPATAGILGVFVVAATALAWKGDREPVFWVANGAAAGEALALAVATHALEPFLAVLLLMALLSEYAAERNHELSVRPLVAAAADAAVWALIFLYSAPQSGRMDYPAIGTAGLLLPGCLLFLIYGVSVVLRTTLLGKKISIFETGQAMIAFLLAASSVLYFEPRSGAIVLGAMCLLFSAACYAAAFAWFAKAAEGRNYSVFSAWAASLLLAGLLLCLPPFWLAGALGLAAVAATVLGVRLNRLTLNFHGLAFLLAAAIQSGLLDSVVRTLAGTVPMRLTGGVLIVSACAILSYVAGTPGPQESWKQQLLRLATAALAAGALAALLVKGLLWLVALGIAPAAHHIALIRTLTLCAVALALAFGGSRWRRAELTHIAYATLGLVAAKLLFEDLRLGHLEFIAASIFLFAITLIAVPRLAHVRQRI
jgi:hypothetical protein